MQAIRIQSFRATRSLLLSLCWLAVFTPASGQEAAGKAPGGELKRPRIGLVLSGGGARGLAHVGVLKVLERERIPVDVIAGTSMGAIVGGLYASGMSAVEVEAEVRKLDWDNVFASRVDRRELSQRRKEQDFEVSPLLEVGVGADGLKAPVGSVSSRGLESHLRRLTLSARHIKSFDDLPTPFRAVATDMETGQAVTLKDGDLATALRSSMSVPGVFAPVEVNGRILGDGGLVNNTPVDVARQLGAERLIVVNIGTPLARRETLSSLTGVTAQMINILTEQNVRQSLAALTPQDVLIAPTLEGMTAADFNRAPEFMNLGELQAEAMVLRMQDLKLSEADYAQWKARRVKRQAQAAPLTFVRFEGSQLTHPDERSDILLTQPGQVFDVAKAERDITVLAASGDYQGTDYRLVRTPDGQEGLVFALKDKIWGPDYLQMGLDFSADNRGRSAFNLKLVHNRHWLDKSGTEWRNFLRLGTAPALGTELYRPTNWRLPDGLSGFMSGSLLTQRRSLAYYIDPDGEQDAQVERSVTSYNLDVGANWRELGEWRLGVVDEAWRDAPSLASANYAALRASTSASEGVDRWRERGWRIKMVFDQLDHAFFPTHGWRLEGNWMQGRSLRRGDSAGPEGRVRHLELQGQRVQSWGAHSFNVFARLGMSDGVSPDIPRYGLGGFQMLSGYGPFQVSGQQIAMLRLGYQLRLTDMALTRGLFFGSSFEVGNAWERPEDIGRGKKRTGLSLYLGADTAFGPVYGAIVNSPVVGPTLMLFVGRP
ncbi:MAG TPA: patatin-like phospholipase family protein [Aquabacterium sp.]|uniref:patatin-like phospholipase family protein n=1 Tax=Aquabacterium sp. TaxID=1872578 RepID=UPI002E33123D|nr:patatin-like phospholipase family protein [Aquabacterium sp.]HEX5357005.1 patatin-like phospholipase family protein [Aquabacterium sp.]